MVMQERAYSIELKDATLRDEDISAVVFTVEIKKRPDGLYEYVYQINNPIDNKGIVSQILINLNCNVEFEPIVLPDSNDKPGYLGDMQAESNSYTPTTIRADHGSAASYGLTINNEALWGARISQGQKRTGLRLISPAAPGMRLFTIKPRVSYADGTWFFPEDDSIVPDTIDFTITGMIAAPGCPGVTEPPETALYPGATFQVEPENINKLLQYRSPQIDRFHVDAGTNETEIHIYYGKDIDSKTFKIEPAYLKHYFNPVAGTDEKISLPLKKARNKIKLSVHTIKATGTTRKENEIHHSYKDTDVFEIRVDGNKK